MMQKIKNDYFILDESLVLRDAILNAIHDKFIKTLRKGHVDKQELNDSDITKSRMTLRELSESCKSTIELIIVQTSVLMANGEIDYINKEGFSLGVSGYNAAVDKKYIRLAEDVKWKNRERTFNFVTKPVFVIISFITMGIAIRGCTKETGLKEDLQRMELKLKASEAKIFELDNKANKQH